MLTVLEIYILEICYIFYGYDITVQAFLFTHSCNRSHLKTLLSLQNVLCNNSVISFPSFFVGEKCS